MTKKLKTIKFQDFHSSDELLNFLIENGIDYLEHEDGRVFHYSESEQVWEENKPEDLKKFKA
jgi:hypothetical protein